MRWARMVGIAATLWALGCDGSSEGDAGPRDGGSDAGYDAGSEDERVDAGRGAADAGPTGDAAAPDGGVDAGPATADAGRDGGPPDAGVRDPCELAANWTCPQEGGGDCIATCGSYRIEIFTSSAEFLCFPPGGGEIACADPGPGDCAGCLALAANGCCFP